MMRRALPWLLVALALLGAVLGWVQRPALQAGLIGVVAPDGLDASDPRLAVWLDAIHEQGLRSAVASVSSLVADHLIVPQGQAGAYAVLILPDQVMRQGDHHLQHFLRDFVRSGGALLVCFDALTEDDPPQAPDADPPAATLVGLHYAQANSQGSGDVAYGPVLGSQHDLDLLALPPGKAELWPQQAAGTAAPDALLAITSYRYGYLTYAHRITHGTYDGHVLLRATDGSVVLGEGHAGRGSVLFANLPLGYLKGRTDGLLLHAVLDYLAGMAGLPTQQSVPEGIGGLVFNWHVDANTALFALEEFERRGLLAQGPFSIHLTTGPDTYRVGDRAGMDLEHNPIMQRWVQRFRQRGDALGNHGGWIHNYFAQQLSERCDPRMVALLERNDAVLSAVASTPIREYSAPMGAQPQWVTDWIEQRGVVAYYFTGNTGMAPTRSYRDGRLNARSIWSFPIMTLGAVASFEEAFQAGFTPLLVQGWLLALTDFVARSSTVRTLYSHPPGWMPYFDAIQAWFGHTAELVRSGRFRWYTMQRMADFLKRREEVDWQVRRAPAQHVFTAAHPQSLVDMAWLLPKSRYGRPQFDPAQLRLEDTGTAWRLVARDTTALRFTAALQPGWGTPP